MIDLRSDTVTRPTPGMREAMAAAPVGDDVYNEDPTVLELEREVALLLGKESALFVPSGTMANQIAIAIHTRPGDEVIAGLGAHPVWYECAAGAALSGVQFATIGNEFVYDADQMEAAVRPADYYFPRSSLVWVENTVNRAGGRVFPQPMVEAIASRAKARGLALHLDGARLWNAAVASARPEHVLALPFDTVSVCFSKGLGAPVGSALVGSRADMERARRYRKMFGGGMRQAGIVAAGALYALRHHRHRLAEDHDCAKLLAGRLSKAPHAHVDTQCVETNMVNVELDVDAARVAKVAAELGVSLSAFGPKRLRAVTHLDVTKDAVIQAGELLAKAIALVAAERRA